MTHPLPTRLEALAEALRQHARGRSEPDSNPASPRLQDGTREELGAVRRILESMNVETRDLHEIDESAPSAAALLTASRVLLDIAERIRHNNL